MFVQYFERGSFASVPRYHVQLTFGEYLAFREPNYWHLHYDDLNFCNIGVTSVQSDESFIHCLAVHRPCADARLWDALFSVLRLGNAILYLPDCKSPLVADSAVTEHLPPSMVSSLGQPVCVCSGTEIMQNIEAA